jgi:hypothetical protein
MQTNKLIRIISLALAGLFNLFLGLVYLPSIESGWFPLVAIVLGCCCVLIAIIVAYRDFHNLDTPFPLTKQVLVIPLALAGLLILNYGMAFLRVFGFSTITVATMIVAMVVCVCALVFSFGEEDGTIRLFRIAITAMIGVGIMAIGMKGLLIEDSGRIGMVYYSVVFVSIIILCIALYLAHKEYGSYDIKLRGYAGIRFFFIRKALRRRGSPSKAWVRGSNLILKFASFCQKELILGIRKGLKFWCTGNPGNSEKTVQYRFFRARMVPRLVFSTS